MVAAKPEIFAPPLPVSMDYFLDNLLNSPNDSVVYRDICAAVIAEVQSEMCDPVVETFQSLCQMTADKIAHFDPLCPSPPGAPPLHPDDSDNPSDEDSTMGRENPHFCIAPKYFYRIGEYETSSFYSEFLSDELICAPSRHMVLVREMTDNTSRNPKSSFSLWFCMPLFMVSEIF